jgi:hypothetical protein
MEARAAYVPGGMRGKKWCYYPRSCSPKMSFGLNKGRMVLNVW